ncbi:BBE domain-containing protein [Nocardia sp. NPDC059239]|uniref:BBE domain-containing protein n=1 Tax=unclassified Nocardia TaxID=2637762 RepID=UPI00369FB18B
MNWELVTPIPYTALQQMLDESSPAGLFAYVDHDQHRVRESYGDKYSRLVALKSAWDTDNVFHHNANIPPA